MIQPINNDSQTIAPAALSYAVLGEASKTYVTFGKQDASEFYFSIVRTGI